MRRMVMQERALLALCQLVSRSGIPTHAFETGRGALRSPVQHVCVYTSCTVCLERLIPLSKLGLTIESTYVHAHTGYVRIRMQARRLIYGVSEEIRA